MGLATRSIALAGLWIALLSVETVSAGPLRVVATIPDLADLAREVGGAEVDVKAFARGREDPHFVEAKPSFIRALSRAELLLTIGLDLELGWLPPLRRNARNPRALSGGSGDFDASRGIPLLQVMTGGADRSMGDVHPRGNPHYLLDPVNGLRVARRLEHELSRLRPERADYFGRQAADFERRLVRALVGEAVVTQRGVVQVAEDLLAGEPIASGADAGPNAVVGGWLGIMAPHRGKSVIADHDLWPYFANRFGIEVVDFLEPLPGVSPTTRHLSALAGRVKSERIAAILTAAYFHPRYAEKLAAATGARVVEMANQVGSREGVDGYLSMIDWNVRRLADAL